MMYKEPKYMILIRHDKNNNIVLEQEKFVNKPKLDDYYRLIECDCISHAIIKINNKLYDVIFDDEFLLNDSKASSPDTFKCLNYFESLKGNVLVCKYKRNSEDFELFEDDELNKTITDLFFSILTNGYYEFIGYKR